jgi:branched-chain amino acid transport system permease protein
MADILLQGLLVGGLYALLALGFAMIFKASQVMNLAYGQQILIISYLLYWFLMTVGLPTWLGILLVFIIGAAIAFLIERLAIRPLMGQPFLSILMMTLMLGFLLKGIAVLIWGGQSFSYPFTPGGMINIGSVQILPAALYAFVTALFIFGLLLFLFQYTKIGLAMRVVAADHLVSQSLGIRVKRIFSISWVLSGLVAAVCAILAGMVQMITPEMGDLALGKGLPVLLLGGMDSIPGALVGGLGIGVVESLGGYWGGEIREIVPWIVMLLILLVRPWGLFGQHRIERI